MKEKIRIAIQKSGRLYTESVQLLKDCDINFNDSNNQLKIECTNFPLDIFFLRNSDIPRYLNDNVIDLAILGKNLVEEASLECIILENLGFSKCRVSIAVPKQQSFSNIDDLNGKKIATSYPNTLSKFLKEKNISSEIHVINGSVEIAPNIGLSDAVCDIVSTGSTLYENNLKEFYKLFDSEALLVQRKNIGLAKDKLINQLQFRIKSVIEGKKIKYIIMNVENDTIEKVSKILPVLKSPSVTPLVKAGWSSLQTVINVEDFWDIIYKLKNEGAQDILVTPIEKVVR
jgi:ATP phosphoribosyltransferase